MKTIFRTLPGLVTAFLLGAMVMSRFFTTAPAPVRAKELGALIAAGAIVTLFAVLTTRRRPQQQSTGFGTPARARNGR